MRPARLALLFVLLVSSAAVSGASAQESEPAAPSTEPTDTAVAPNAAQPEELGYEPDQRGAIEPEPSPSGGPPASSDSPAQMGPPMMDAEGAMDEYAPDDSDEPPSVYLELLNGYAYLDPAAFSEAGALASSTGYHGYRLGLAAGLHLSSIDAGLRFEHGFHAHGVDVNALALEARLGLTDGDFVPQLRLAVGLLLLSDLSAGGATLDTLIGASLESGIGARVMLGDTLSLGAALDLGLTYTQNDAVDATGFDLKLHVDLGLHF